MTANSNLTQDGKLTCTQCKHINPSYHTHCEKCGARLSLMAISTSAPPKIAVRKVSDAKPIELTPMSHLLCGWPFILVIIGGAIGGALGGLAYAINVAIYKSDLPGFLKIGLNLIVGFMAIGTWIVIAVAITQK